jgi:hypothetical protein
MPHGDPPSPAPGDQAATSHRACAFFLLLLYIEALQASIVGSRPLPAACHADVWVDHAASWPPRTFLTCVGLRANNRRSRGAGLATKGIRSATGIGRNLLFLAIERRFVHWSGK